ncbi:hypothetical protein DPMN_137411 [Dreissena polymorpha]|uniref:Uncharacterized protein n=1 Tax=Dreissena polymorpha TaxID=45954 RepID=A0A9D4G1V6_DREPO|nr:hypothetical protein DPMN_137411 [Dreissena polymorpha]
MTDAAIDHLTSAAKSPGISHLMKIHLYVFCKKHSVTDCLLPRRIVFRTTNRAFMFKGAISATNKSCGNPTKP